MFLMMLALLAPGAEEKSFVAPGAKIEKLWSEGEFTEGPAEGPDGGIYFSDIGNRIMRFDPKTKETTAFRDPGGRSNGLKFDARGRLIACEGANTGGGRRISITEKDGTVVAEDTVSLPRSRMPPMPSCRPRSTKEPPSSSVMSRPLSQRIAPGAMVSS